MHCFVIYTIVQKISTYNTGSERNVMAHQRKKGRRHWDELTGKHTLGDAGQLFFFCLFGVVWVMDTFFLRYTTFLNEYIPSIVRVVVGVAFLIISVYLASTGLVIVFGKGRRNTGVIREGVFNYVRHPIYLSEILLYFGLLMLSMSLAAALVWLMAIGFLHYISRHEERLLLARFGTDYEQYMRDVSMWIPRLKRK
jgi:protein-S-isoprenylcysteine O-methyltransferase Ste14